MLVQQRQRVKEKESHFQQRWTEAQDRIKDVEKTIHDLNEHYLVNLHVLR